jgi:hypothetical protein
VGARRGGLALLLLAGLLRRHRDRPMCDRVSEPEVCRS